VWTTDKDGMVPNLLAAEMTARTGQDPGKLHEQLLEGGHAFFYERIDAPATVAEKEILKKLSPAQLDVKQLAGDPVRSIISTAPGNKAPIGGVKVLTDQGWFAARPSGTEDVYKIYAESFRSEEHLRQIQREAQAIHNKVFEAAKVRAH
jgi:phosphoglucomutase